MRTLFTGLLLLWTTAVPCFSVAPPSVTAQVSEADGIKYYAYTLTNSLEGGSLYGFVVYMPESGARSVFGFQCSKPGWYQDNSFRGEYSMWAMAATSSAKVMPGEQVTFTLTTPDSVPTLAYYVPTTYASNWTWFVQEGEAGFGANVLPVPGPVPEPSSIAALALGLLPLGAVLARRRRP